MKTALLLVATLTSLMLVAGCTITDFSYQSIPVESEYDSYRNDYVDTYINLPEGLRYLIADHVDGYSMPPISRYSEVLYPRITYSDPDNLPSYVAADLNGDGYEDYAMLFSALWWDRGDWYLKTKMLIAIGTRRGYTLVSETVLGTVTGSSSTRVAEYWGIRLLKKGTHSIDIVEGYTQTSTDVQLSNNAIYLASIDPDERSIFYLTGNYAEEMYLDMGAIAKKKATTNVERSERVITVPLKK